VRIMHSLTAFRILYLPARLKRKLRASANRSEAPACEAGTGCSIIRGVL